MIVLLAILFADVGRCEPRCHCDIIELNHKLDELGNVAFTQIIIWNWKPEVCRHHVEAWWMVDVNNLHLMPCRKDESIVVRRIINEKPVEVIAKGYRETKTNNDPEVDDKRIWHESRRRLPACYFHKSN